MLEKVRNIGKNHEHGEMEMLQRSNLRIKTQRRRKMLGQIAELLLGSAPWSERKMFFPDKRLYIGDLFTYNLCIYSAFSKFIS